MFKPARMTRILVGGHQDRMPEVIEALHAEGVVHIEDFRDPTGVTRIGTPQEAGDQVTDLLLRVRGIQKAFDVEGAEARTLATPEPQAMVEEAEQVILPLVQRLAEINARLAQEEAMRDRLASLMGLDADLGLLREVQAVRAWLGTVRADPTDALAASGVAHDITLTKTGAGRTVLALARPEDAAAMDRVLAEAGYQAIELPDDVTGTPAEAVAHIEAEQAALQVEAAAVEGELAGLRSHWAGRLASLEAYLAGEAQKTLVPIQFGVTDNTFHVEGWVPRSGLNRLENVLAHRFEESLYLEVLGDAPREPVAAGHAAGDHHAGEGSHDDHGHGATGHQDHGHDDHSDHDHPDHDHHVAVEDEAPTQLDNRGGAHHFQFMLRLLALPRYREIDPTKLLWIFFPLFLGLMVGDVVIGLFIVLFALYLRNHRIFGIGGSGVARPLLMGGILAIIFGAFLFGEGLGMHFVLSEEALEAGEHSWESAFGVTFPTEGFIHKVEPHALATEASMNPDALGALVPHAVDAEGHGGPLTPHAAAHLSVNGWFNLGVYSKVHDVEALLIWSIMIGVVHIALGFMLGVRNVAIGHGVKLAIQEKLSWLLIMASVPVIYWGLSTGPSWALWGGVGLFAVSTILLYLGVQATIGYGFIAFLEIPGLLGNILSYTRLAAIGASKAGMAIAFATIGFDLIGGVAGIIVYLLASLLITALAILSGSLQALRLQFVEFFGKFYEGGGRPYVPFGRRAAQPPSTP